MLGIHENLPLRILEDLGGGDEVYAMFLKIGPFLLRIPKKTRFAKPHKRRITQRNPLVHIKIHIKIHILCISFQTVALARPRVQRTDDREQKIEVRGQKSEKGQKQLEQSSLFCFFCPLFPAFCVLSSDLCLLYSVIWAQQIQPSEEESGGRASRARPTATLWNAAQQDDVSVVTRTVALIKPKYKV